MSLKEYKYWAIGAIVSAVVWLIMIFVKTESILSALIGTTVGCFTFRYWIRSLAPNRNVRLSYIIGVFVTLLVNKLIGVQWLLAILISFFMMLATMFIALYVCTVKYASKDDETKQTMYYRANLKRN